MEWIEFLEGIATENELRDTARDVFIARLCSVDRLESDTKVARELSMSVKTLKNHLTSIYETFETTCPELAGSKPGKLRKLKAYLWKRYKGIDSTCSQPPIISTPTQEQYPIAWEEVCRRMLSQGATTNPLMEDKADKHDRSHIYVPLALVERTKPDKRPKEDGSPEAGSELYKPQYEEKQRFEHEAFLKEVLADGMGKSKGQRIAVIGEAGAGKTTLLQAIADRILEQDLGLPIWISLATLQGKNLKEYLFQNWLADALQVFPVMPDHGTELEKLFHSQRVWLLLDGVDEVAAAGNATRRINDQIQRGLLSKARVVLTCRLNVWQADVNFLEGFETYRLLDFSYPDQVNEFIDNWFQGGDSQAADPDKGERLKQALGTPERLRLQDLSKNPLRLTLLCQIWRSREGRLPDTKADLYAWYVEKVHHWNEHRFPEGSEPDALTQALGKLALQNIDASGSRFRLRESVVKKALKPDLLKLALQLNWLNRVGIAAESQRDEPVYAFFHATFQEYFAATAIDNWQFFLHHDNQDPQPLLGNYRIFEPQWKEVFLLWLGQEDVKKEQKEMLIQALVKFDDGCGGFYAYQAYFLAVAAIAEFRDYSEANEVLTKAARLLHRPQNTKGQTRLRCPRPVRTEASRALLKTDFSRVISILEKELHSREDESFQWCIANILRQIDPSNYKAISTLVQLFKCTENYAISRVALESLLPIDSVYPLFEVRSDYLEGYYLWRESAESFGRSSLVNSAVVAELIQVLQSQPYTLAKVEMANILGQTSLGKPAVILALEQILQSLKYATLSLPAVARSMLEIDHNRQTTGMLKILELIENEGLEQIDISNPIAISALAGMCCYNFAQGEDYELWNIHDYVELWKYTIETLVHIDPVNSVAIEPLITLLVQLVIDLNESTVDHTSLDFFQWAIRTLGQATPNNPEAIAVLTQLLQLKQDSWWTPENIRLQIILSLGLIDPGNPEAIRALIQEFFSGHSSFYDLWFEDKAKLFSKVVLSNPAAVKIFIQEVESIRSSFPSSLIAESLGKVDPENHIAINFMLYLLKQSLADNSHPTIADEHLLKPIIKSLEKINLNDSTSIGAVVRFLQYVESMAEHNSHTTGCGNQLEYHDHFGQLVSAVNTNSDFDEIYKLVTHSLAEIALSDPTAINEIVSLFLYAREAGQLEREADGFVKTLLHIFELAKEDSYFFCIVAESLRKNALGNSTEINVLVRALVSIDELNAKMEVMQSLQEMLPGTPTAIDVLVQMLESREYISFAQLSIASALGELDPGNATAINALVQIIKSSENRLDNNGSPSPAVDDGDRFYAVKELLSISPAVEDSDRFHAVEELLNISSEENLPALINIFSSDLLHIRDPERFENFYLVLWHCAQTLPYLVFHQAWHTDN